MMVVAAIALGLAGFRKAIQEHSCSGLVLVTLYWIVAIWWIAGLN
jgi:hypothetical protein